MATAEDPLALIEELVKFNQTRPDLDRRPFKACPGCIPAYIDEADEEHDPKCIYIRMLRRAGQ